VVDGRHLQEGKKGNNLEAITEYKAITEYWALQV
jgi:hypothetical protein